MLGDYRHMQLSQIDVERLAQAGSAKERVEVAGKLAAGFAAGQLSGREKDVAVAIFRLLARDAEVRVREQLSVHLHACDDLPHDVALQLAHDVTFVAVPILEYSNVLGDSDLIAIIDSARETAKLTAIARREIVTEYVSDALLHTRNATVASTLLSNKGAEISEHSLLHTIEAMADRESVIEALMERGGLPVVCVEKIFMTVSDHMKKKLAEQYHVSRHLIEGKLEYAREMTTLDVSQRADNINVEALVRHLRIQRKLTSSIVIRSLCVGDMRFFEHAMAELTDVPLENVRRLMCDAGPNGFKSLYRLSPLPPAYFEAVKKLLDLALDATYNGYENPADFSARMIDNIVNNGYDHSIEYMPLLLAIIKGNASEFPRLH